MKKGQNFNRPSKGSLIKVQPIKNIQAIKQIQDALRDIPRNLVLFTLGINTPLRISELLSIRFKDATAAIHSGRLELVDAKTKKKRNLIICDPCVDVVKRFIDSEYEKSGNKTDPDRPVFMGRKGHLTVSTVNNLVKKWCADAGLNGNYGGHTLRKTFGYQRLINSDISISEMMVLFGYSSPRQLLEYLCVTAEEMTSLDQVETIHAPKSVISELNQKISLAERKICELEQRIKELKESEDKFRTFFENVNDQIVYTDLAGRVLEVNDATYDIFGQTREEALGKHISELGIFSQETLDTIIRQSEITAKDNPPPRVELEAFHRDGSKVYIDVNSKLMKKDGDIIGIISIVRDITDRKKVEAALQESREMSRALLNATTDSVMLLDANGYILDLNASYAEKFNRSVEDTIGLCLWNLLPPDMAEKRKEKFNQVFQSGKSVRLEEEYRGLWFDNVVYPVLDRNKKVSSVAIFSHDITARKQAEEALKNHRDQLEKLVKERTANLEDANTALKVLLKRREEDKIELEEKMLVNVKELVLPYLQELKINLLNDRQKSIVNIIESNLNDVISPFVHGLSTKYYSLAPMEIRIANLIKQGKTTKEIAEILKVSPRTVDNHRYNIRKKLGINNEKANLTTHLLTIE